MSIPAYNLGDPLRTLVRAGQRVLRDAGVESAGIDSEVLMMHLLGVDRVHLFLAYTDPPTPEIPARFWSLIERRLTGEPVAYLTGHKEFMGLDFVVDERVLVPRPETERLVEWAVERLARFHESRSVVDVGTGSGAIAVSLAHVMQRSDVRILACDISAASLEVARENVERLAPGRVELVHGDLLAWCEEPLDLVLANLPYLRHDQGHPGISWEPPAALFTGSGGLQLYEELLPQVRGLSRGGGAVACEIDPSQVERATALAARVFPNAKCRVEADLAGLERYLFIEDV